MSTPMLNNFLAAFKGFEMSPLYGKSLVYLLGSPASTFRPIPGSVVEPPYEQNVLNTDDKIAYCNLFNENYGDQSAAERAALGPYLHTSDTAEQYGEGQIDPRGPGWVKNIDSQFVLARDRRFKYVELDNPDAYSIGTVMEVVTLAHSYGLGVIAKNPVLTKGALQFMAHGNVFGVIVERDAGTPAAYDDLRKRARKDGKLPVWFVFDGKDGAAECAAAIRAGGFKGMGVTYSTGRERNGYNDCHTVLLPVT